MIPNEQSVNAICRKYPPLVFKNSCKSAERAMPPVMKIRVKLETLFQLCQGYVTNEQNNK